MSSVCGSGMEGDRGDWAKLQSPNRLATTSLHRGSRDPRPGKRQAPVHKHLEASTEVKCVNVPFIKVNHVTSPTAAWEDITKRHP